MATIQVREIPAEAYDVLVGRARAKHQSLQAYMRDVLVEFASRPSKEEAFAMVERYHRDHPGDVVSIPAILEAIDEGRRSR